MNSLAKKARHPEGQRVWSQGSASRKSRSPAMTCQQVDNTPAPKHRSNCSKCSSSSDRLRPPSHGSVSLNLRLGKTEGSGRLWTPTSSRILRLHAVGDRRSDRPVHRLRKHTLSCLAVGDYAEVHTAHNPEGSREHIGALLLGYYTEDGRLYYAGRAGTGMSAKELKRLAGVLVPLELEATGHPLVTACSSEPLIDRLSTLGERLCTTRKRLPAVSLSRSSM